MARHINFFKEDRGSILIEASVAFIALIIVFFGIMEFCRAVYADLYVGYAAQTASRYAIVRGSTWNGTVCGNVTASSCTASSGDVVSFVHSITPVGINTGSDLTILPQWPGINAAGTPCNIVGGANNPGCVVQVQVSYSFHFLMPFLPKNTLSLASTSVVTISQ